MEPQIQLKEILQNIVQEPQVHACWLNTLSLMENTGARKISAGEHPFKTGLIVLKHAAEEHRHAYILKSEIQKVAPGACPDYSPEYLLCPWDSFHYLHKLDVEASRYLRGMGLNGADLRFGAYLLVTYAIEVRADELYPVYQEVLQAQGQKVSVRGIILEEEGHLEEMIRQLQETWPNWQTHTDHIIRVEEQLFQNWLRKLGKSVLQTQASTA